MPSRLSRWTKAVLDTNLRAGYLTIAMAVVATIWANLGAEDNYNTIRDTVLTIGPLSLSVHKWAADFLLAFFFLVVGIELRHEFTAGSLNTRRSAIVPVMGAIGGIILPAIIFSVINWGQPSIVGWAIPAATDIAFALAVLALVARSAPPALRTFLLTLAVVDDLGAISIIAIFYTPSVNFISMAVAIGLLAVFAAIQRTRAAHPAILSIIGLSIWYFTYSSGVHATIAGVAIGLLLTTSKKSGSSLAARAMSAIHPFTSNIAVPLFVLMSAGVSFSTFSVESITSPVFLGIVLGLLIGKPLGILGFVWLSEKLFQGQRGIGMSWWKVLLAGTVASIGFTVALLINELAFGQSTEGHTAVAAITASAIIASAVSFAVSRVVRS
jgi:NhaA family Na+:H+ antiporter